MLFFGVVRLVFHWLTNCPRMTTCDFRAESYFYRRRSNLKAYSVDQSKTEVSLAGSTDIVGGAERAAVAVDWTAEGRPGRRGQIVFIFQLVGLARNAGPI
jgi:hypothetical protein